MLYERYYFLMRGSLALLVVLFFWAITYFVGEMPTAYLFKLGETSGVYQLTMLSDMALAFVICAFWARFYRSKYVEKDDEKDRFIEPITVGHILGIVLGFIIEAFSGFVTLNFVFVIMVWIVGICIGMGIYLNDSKDDNVRYVVGFSITYWGIAIILAGIFHGFLFPYGALLAFWIGGLANKKRKITAEKK